MTMKTFTAVVYQEDDLFVADCPEVGTVSQGNSIDEAIANLKEATELHLEEFPLPASGTPYLTSFEVNYAQTA
jgi:predicted RNase H-like HicB family nuclease